METTFSTNNWFNLNAEMFLPFLELSSDGILITDSSATIIFYNDAMSRIDGLKPEEMIGKRTTDTYGSDHYPSLVMLCKKKLKSILDYTCYYRTRQGRVVNAICNTFPLEDNGRFVGVIAFTREYGEMKHEITSLEKIRLESKDENSQICRFETLIGESFIFKKAVSMARRAASTPTPIMLFGETGTGKELFAKSIHNASWRREKEFVAINCSTIPENLLEGILFGTAKGSFTGALEKAGLFEQASGGTIFLDEINSMPMGLQSKLLRVLQEQQVRRVGGSREITIDVKIISAVNRDPLECVQQNLLRQDLFYRLAVVYVRIPQLTERLDDIELLTSHFLEKHNKRLNKKIPGVSKELIIFFFSYTWPGNIRELEHIIEGGMNFARNGELLTQSHLPDHMNRLMTETNTKPESDAAAYVGLTQVEEKNALPYSREMFEIEKIKKILDNTGGNVSRSARILCISRQTLQYKMKRFRINRSDFLS
jgi:arginine utilization regulatory protein